MKLKTIDTIKENNKIIFKIKQDLNGSLYIDNDVIFLMIKHSIDEYRENKKIITDKLKIELSDSMEKINNRWKI